MKRLLILLLVFICLFGSVKADMPATPTDLEVAQEEVIEIEQPKREILLSYDKKVYYYGEPVTLISTLVNFLPTDKVSYRWEYSTDCENWEIMPGANESTLTFILDYTTSTYWWRVVVTVETEE